MTTSAAQRDDPTPGMDARPVPLAVQVTPPQVPPRASPRPFPIPRRRCRARKRRHGAQGRDYLPHKCEIKGRGEVWTAREPRGQGEPRPANMVEAAGSRDPPASGSEGRAAGVRGQHGGDSERETEGKGLEGESGGENAERKTLRGERGGEARRGCSLRAGAGRGGRAHLPWRAEGGNGAGGCGSAPLGLHGECGGAGRPRQAEHGAGRAPLRPPQDGAAPAPLPQGSVAMAAPALGGGTARCSLREKPPAAGAYA